MVKSKYSVSQYQFPSLTIQCFFSVFCTFNNSFSISHIITILSLLSQQKLVLLFSSPTHLALLFLSYHTFDSSLSILPHIWLFPLPPTTFLALPFSPYHMPDIYISRPHTTDSSSSPCLLLLSPYTEYFL